MGKGETDKKDGKPGRSMGKGVGIGARPDRERLRAASAVLLGD
mgnify:CR=1 FL=1